MSKVLVLGAYPPFEGPWVPLAEEVHWCVRAQVLPAFHELNGKVRIEVMTPSGAISVSPLGGRFIGLKARAVLGEIDGVESISIFLEEAS